MTIKEIIDSLEINNLEKNKLLVCLLRNTDEYHNRLETECFNLKMIGNRISFRKFVEIVLSSNDEITINYLVASLKDYKYY